MPEKTTILCITCPKGCTLEVTYHGHTIQEVRPGCKRGHEYAQREITDPRRMVASSVRIADGIHPLLPVFTSAPFPKAKIMPLMVVLRNIDLHAPIKMGAVILANALDTGIDILASRDMPVKAKGE
jgi:CxxC motif-containing protein